MRRKAIAFSLIVAATSGCVDQPTAYKSMITSPLQAKGQPQATPIAVTVEDIGPLGPYKITSDGLGEYVSGMQGMTSEIDPYGNLQITPANATSGTPPVRTLVFDFNSPTDPLNSYRPNESGQHNFKIKTSDYGNPRIQDLGVNGNPVSGCYQTTVAHENTTTHHRAVFNSLVYSPTTYAYVTRATVSPATWTMVSDGPCAGNANWGSVWSQDLVKKNAPLIFRGYYNLQFAIRFRAI